MHDARLLELLTSKICHDLISPVGAIGNGLELIEDIGDSVAEEAMALIATSARSASRRLRLFRLCYGRAGSESGLALRDVRAVATDYYSEGRVTLEWPVDPWDMLASESLPQGLLKTCLNTILLAEEALPYGGTLVVMLSSIDPLRVQIEAKGRAARLSDEHRHALEDNVSVDDLTSRTVQAYVTDFYAKAHGLAVHMRSVDDETMVMDITTRSQTSS